ncbi:MAG: hypothetical protein AAB225_15255 [Acidobacteriota bacterium]
MTCGRFERWIALEVEGDLPARKAGRLARHLEACDGCRELAASLRASQAALRALREEPVSEAELRLVRQRVLACVRAGEAVRAGWLRWAWVGAAALVLVAGLSLWRPRPVEAPPPPAVARVEAPIPAVVPSEPAPARPRPKPERPAGPLLVRLETADPQVVIYWIFDENGG